MVKQTTCCMYLMLITKCTEQLVGVLVGTQNMSDGYSVRVSHQAAYAALISCKAKLNPRHIRWPEPKGIQEPALCPSLVSHLQIHHPTHA